MRESTAALAGLHDRRRPPSEGDLASLARSLEGEGPVRTWADRDLAVAWVGAPAGARRDLDTPRPFVLLHGHIYNQDELVPSPRWTDPLAAACGDEGDDLLRRLRGDFVLLVYDPSTGRGMLARDQMGGRGLVWRRSAGRLYFATEVRPLLRLLPTRPGPDPAALGHWLAISAMPGPRTLYEGIERLETAHRLRFGEGWAPPRRYWSPVYRTPAPVEASECAAGIRAVLTTSVQRRCRDGTVTGVLLSGGLDSSSVASVGARLEGRSRLRSAYSATFPDHPSVDETTLIASLSADLRLEDTRAIVRSGSVLAGAVEYIRHWELPPPSPNLFFWYPLLRQASADGMTTLIDGEGGDELFGLSPYLIADRLRRGHIRVAADLVRRIPGGGRHLPRSTIWRYLRDFGVKGNVPAGAHEAFRRALGRGTRAVPWLRQPLLDAYLSTDECAAWKRISGPRWWAFLVETTTRGPGPALAYDHVRRRAAQCGLDASHPLVDVDVIEYVLGMPPELAYDPRFSRPLLREAMRGLLREEVRVRPTKSTFDAVFHDALAGPDLEVARELLRDDRAALAEFVDLRQVQHRLLVGPPAEGPRWRWAIALWRLLTAECWLRAQDSGRPEPGHLALAAADVEVVGPPSSRA